MKKPAVCSSAAFRTAALPLAALAWTQLTYQGAFFLTAARRHFDFSLPIDRSIPLVPWTMLIYFGCYLWWAGHYIYLARRGGAEMRRFYTADFWSKVLSFSFFLALPTVMFRPDVTGTGFWNDAVRFLYRADQPYNLFPSVHCSISWLCWASVRRDSRSPVWYRGTALICAAAVCISTLTTRQHVVLDLLGGILTAELCWSGAARSNAYHGDGPCDTADAETGAWSHSNRSG